MMSLPILASSDRKVCYFSVSHQLLIRLAKTIEHVAAPCDCRILTVADATADDLKSSVDVHPGRILWALFLTLARTFCVSSYRSSLPSFKSLCLGIALVRLLRPNFFFSPLPRAYHFVTLLAFTHISLSKALRRSFVLQCHTSNKPILRLTSRKLSTTHGYTPQQNAECRTLRIPGACDRLVTSRLVVMSTVWADNTKKKNKSNNKSNENTSAI